MASAQARLTDPDCVFCRIVAGAIPCYRIYEDDRVLAFLDVGPLSRGHSLVVPKGHYRMLTDMPAELAGACMATAAKLSAAVTKAAGVGAWNVLQNNGATAGQVVMHVHFHIIPRRAGDGLGYRWPAGKLEKAEAEKLLAAIRGEMG